MGSESGSAVDALTRAVRSALLVGFSGTTAPDWLLDWAANGLAGVCLFARNCENPDQVAALVASLRAESPDLLVAIDEEGGLVTRLEAETGSTLPGQAALGHLDETETTRAAARACAARLRALGIDVVLAPVADVNIEPENPVIGVRSFGADPQLVSRHVAAYVEGLRDGGVAACAKHFPGHGDTTVDSHTGLPVVSHDRKRLEAVELPPFRAAVAAGVPMVMSAHLVVPALDEQPATLSPAVLTGLLRDELGFGGAVVTDALEMAAVADRVGVREAAVQAMLAGADVLCTGAEEQPALEAEAGLRQAVEAERVPLSRLEEATGRVRDVVAWTRDTRSGKPLPVNDFDAYDVVRRATVVHDPAGRLPIGRAGVEGAADAVTVLDVSPPVFTGTGGAGADLGSALRGALPGTRRVQVHGDVQALELASPGPVVLTVRDLGTNPDSGACVRRALTVRPDAVVVLTGLLAESRLLPEGTSYIAVHAPGAVHLKVAADLLTDR